MEYRFSERASLQGQWDTDMGFRFSTGLALQWASPVGPLKFSFAFPVAKKEGDRIQRFQFQVGTVF